MANLVQHRPSFPIAQAKLFRERQSRKPTFISTRQKYCPEPEQKRSSRIMHYSSGCQRCLMPTFLALIQLTLNNMVIFLMPTDGTSKSLRPAEFKKSFFTIFFCLIFCLKFQKAYFLVWFIHNNFPFPIYLRFDPCHTN